LLRGSCILWLFPYVRAARIQDPSSRFYIRSPSPPLGPGSQFPRGFCSLSRVEGSPPLTGFCILDPGICGRLGVCAEGSGPPGFWILDPGICGRLGVRAGAPGYWMLESVGGVGRRGPAADSVFCILETGLSEGRSTGVGRPDSVFCILEAWASRVAGPPGFCILYSVFCPRHVHVMHMHGSRDGT